MSSGGGGTLGNSWWGCTVRWWLVLQILALFQTKKCHFPHQFSDLDSCFHRQKLYPITVTLHGGGHRECGVWSEREQEDFLKSISNSHITLSSHSFGTRENELSLVWEWKDKYVQVVPSKTIPDSRPKWVKSKPVFRPAQKPWTYLYEERIPLLPIWLK